MPVAIDQVRGLVHSFPSDVGGADWSILGSRLADSFGWGDGSARVRPISVASTGLGIARASLGSEPGAIFAAAPRLSSEALDQAALFAYHASVPWGLIADHDGAVIFSPRWLRDSLLGQGGSSGPHVHCRTAHDVWWSISSLGARRLLLKARRNRHHARNTSPQARQGGVRPSGWAWASAGR